MARQLQSKPERRAAQQHAEARRAVEHLVLIRMVRLNAVLQGLVTGVLCAGGLFIATNWLVLRGGPHVGEHLKLLANYFPGYEVTFVGSLIGAAYAFAVGFLFAAAAAWLYNLFSSMLRSPERHG